MKAIILAAGKGTRLKPLTDNVPKCLIEINGRTILEYQVRSFFNAGINDVTIVVGYLAESVIKFCNQNRLYVNFILNEEYNDTNNMFSLFLAKNTVYDSDLIICNGDVIFSPNILTGLLQDCNKNAIAVDVNKYFDESMKVIANNGIICEINKNIDSDKALGCSIDLYRFSAEAATLLFEIIEDYINNKKLRNLWTEFAIQELLSSNKMNVFPYDIGGQDWIEIDNHDDLLQAKKLFKILC